MAILDTINKVRLHIKTATGYIKYKFFADDIVTNKGTTVEDELNTINTNLTENSITEQGYGTDGTYTKYFYVKHGNGILEVFGDSAFDASGTSSVRTVNFHKVAFANPESMYILLTLQRNGTLASKIMECDGSGNRQRTSTSFVARCEKNTSQYNVSFTFYVKGFWK